MELRYKSKKLKKRCEDPRLAQKAYGSNIGRKLTLRILELEAAPNLGDVAKIPAARLHRLKGQRKAQFAVDLAHPFRLMFSPIDEDPELSDWTEIEIVRIEEVLDYHGG